MKNLLLFSVAALLISACSSDKLDRETAFKLLQSQKEYPKPVTEEIYIADPEEAKKLLDAGLEQQGVLQVKRTQSLAEAGSPLITFTDKGKPFLIATPEKDRGNNIQLVKVADEELNEVIGIQMVNDNQAEVEFSTVFKNVTPFKILSKKDFSQPQVHKQNFSKYDDGWRVKNQ